MTTPNNTQKDAQNNGWSSAVTAGSSIGNNDDVRQAKDLLLQGNQIERETAHVATEDQLSSIVNELRRVREQLADSYIRKARKYNNVEDSALAILRNSSISVNRTAFNDPAVETQMRAKLRTMVERNQPIMLPLLMGGGKAPNPIKVGANYLPDLAEWVSWSTLEAIGLAIKAVYAPGATILVVPDAGLHTADIGMAIEETLAHISTVRRDLAWLGLGQVIVPDVLPHLGTEWVEGVQRLMAEARHRAESDPTFSADVRSQVSSLMYSINTRVLGGSFAELLPVYAALAGHTEGLSEVAMQKAQELRRRTEGIAFHYVAVNWAIRQLGLVERIVTVLAGAPDHLRLSVHAKPGEPRPALFASSQYFPWLGGLLPMHSVGVRLQADDKVRYGAAFELSARLRRWTPVVAAGDGRFLWFEAKA